MRQLVYNAIRTPDGTVIASRHRHDYVTHVDQNGLTYMVDGGLDYQRRNLHRGAPYEDISLYEDDPIKQIREAWTWGTYGVNGDQPLTWVKLCDMEDDHISAILEMPSVGTVARSLLQLEVEYRA